MVTPSAWPAEGPRRTPLTEVQFSEALSSEGVEFVQELKFLCSQGADSWIERRLYSMYRKSTDLEIFLDDHGAQANQTFFGVRELVAGVRWLSLACSCLVHLRSRIYVYPPSNEEWANSDLPDHLKKAISCFGECLLKCLEALAKEWVKVGLKIPEEEPLLASSPAGPNFVLPANRLPEADERVEAGQKDSLPAARLVGRVIRTIENWAPVHSLPTNNPTERRAFMLELCSEATARDFESRVHNLQSEYDSTIRGSSDEADQPALLQLRGAISQCLHLLEAVTALTHLYERHNVHQRHPATRRVLDQAFDWETYLSSMIDHCLRPALTSLENSKEVAAILIEGLTTKEFRDIVIPQGITLHARPLSLIVGVVHHYGLPVEIEISDERVSAASMMSMLVLCGSHLDAKTVRFHADPAVLNDLQALFEAGLGEDGIDALPGSLKYLIH